MHNVDEMWSHKFIQSTILKRDELIRYYYTTTTRLSVCSNNINTVVAAVSGGRCCCRLLHMRSPATSSFKISYTAFPFPPLQRFCTKSLLRSIRRCNFFLCRKIETMRSVIFYYVNWNYCDFFHQKVGPKIIPMSRVCHDCSFLIARLTRVKYIQVWAFLVTMSSNKILREDICIGRMIAIHIYVPLSNWVFVEFVFRGKNYSNYQWYLVVLVVAMESMTQGKNYITLSRVT